MLLFVSLLQEKRRAERAEQQRVRAEKDKERQARREVCTFIPGLPLPPAIHNTRSMLLLASSSLCHVFGEPGGEADQGGV